MFWFGLWNSTYGVHLRTAAWSRQGNHNTSHKKESSDEEGEWSERAIHTGQDSLGPAVQSIHIQRPQRLLVLHHPVHHPHEGLHACPTLPLRSERTVAAAWRGLDSGVCDTISGGRVQGAGAGSCCDCCWIIEITANCYFSVMRCSEITQCTWGYEIVSTNKFVAIHNISHIEMVYYSSVLHCSSISI